MLCALVLPMANDRHACRCLRHTLSSSVCSVLPGSEGQTQMLPRSLHSACSLNHAGGGHVRRNTTTHVPDPVHSHGFEHQSLAGTSSAATGAATEGASVPRTLVSADVNSEPVAAGETTAAGDGASAEVAAMPSVLHRPPSAETDADEPSMDSGAVNRPIYGIIVRVRQCKGRGFNPSQMKDR